MSMRFCCCTGYLANPGGRCCMDLQDERMKVLVNDASSTINPVPMGATWQCPGCGTIYNMLVSKCECQRRNGSASTTNQTFSVHSGLTCEDVGCPCVQDGGE